MTVLILQVFPNNVAIGQTTYPMRTFVSQNLGIQFQYPSSMGEAMDSGNTVSFVKRDPYSKSIDLIIMRIDTFDLAGTNLVGCKCHTLTDFVKWDYDQKFKTDNEAIILNQSKSINNHISWQTELDSVAGRQPTQILLVWITNGNTGYRLQYSAPEPIFAKYLPGFESMINSFTFPEQKKAEKPTCMIFNLVCL